MSPAPLHEPVGTITQVREGCGPFRVRVNGICVARTSVRPAGTTAGVLDGVEAFASELLRLKNGPGGRHSSNSPAPSASVGGFTISAIAGVFLIQPTKDGSRRDWVAMSKRKPLSHRYFFCASAPIR